MNKKLHLAIILGMFLILIAGCWDSRDLEELSFPLAAAYDLHRPGSSDPTDPPATAGEKRLDLTTAVPNLTPDAPTPVNIETLSGVTIGDVRRRRGLTDADTYVTGMNLIIVLGEELARQGVNPYMDVLWRSSTVSGTMYMAVAAGRGENVIKTPIKTYNNIGSYLKALFNGINRRTFIPVTNISQFRIQQSAGRNPVVPVLERKGNRVVITGAALFKKDRMIGRVGTEEALNLVLLRGLKGKSYLPFAAQVDGTLHRGTVLVNNSRKVEYSRNDQGHRFVVTIEIQGTLQEHSHQYPVDEAHLQEIEKTIEKQITAQCERFIDMMQNELKLDCIDISKYALTKERKNLFPYIDNPDFIKNADIRVKVKVHLKNTGEMR
jgi:Ger(x)C family germination protein